MFVNSKNAQDFCKNIRILKKMFIILKTMLVKRIKVHDFEKKKFVYYFLSAIEKNVCKFKKRSCNLKKCPKILKT